MNQEKNPLTELKKEVRQNKSYKNAFSDKYDAKQGRHLNDEDTKGESNNTNSEPYIRSTNSRGYLKKYLLNRSKILCFTFNRFHIANIIVLRMV